MRDIDIDIDMETSEFFHGLIYHVIFLFAFPT